MATYQWDPAALSQIVAIPAVVAEDHLKLAGPLQLKVLLWFCANAASFDADACAAAVGYTAADCTDAMQYWVSSGILRQIDAPCVTPARPKKPKTAPVRRPSVVKPSITEVAAEGENTPAFAYLLDTVSARLGKPLAPTDMETFLYLYRTVGLPIEVLLMVVGYAAQAERFSVRYIEKIALDWADNGILTIDAAEQHLCYLEHCEQALLHVQTVCQLPTPLSSTAARSAMAEKWVYAWQVSDDLLRFAADVCTQKTGKFDMRYLNGILENWHAQGIQTVEEAAALSGKKAPSPEVAPSEYEQMVQQYVPVYRKKKRKDDI